MQEGRYCAAIGTLITYCIPSCWLDCCIVELGMRFAADGVQRFDGQTSCLTEILFEQAQERARELDSLRAKGQLVGPLHGLPISIKDSFQVKGTEATLGFVAYLDHGPSHENSCLVDVLLDLGAVLYCKTNIPQTLMVCRLITLG